MNACTWVVEEGKRLGGYNVPVIVGDHEDVYNDVMNLVKEHNTKEPFYGKSETLYLRLGKLTTKQRN